MQQNMHGNNIICKPLCSLAYCIYIHAVSAPTVAYPNPEDGKAWELALELAQKTDADIVLATDPDADRLGVYAKDTKTGRYISFTGISVTVASPSL